VSQHTVQGQRAEGDHDDAQQDREHGSVSVELGRVEDPDQEGDR
jgi:hypothetical protein